MAWLASGTVLWLLLTLLVTTVFLAGSLVTPSTGWLIAAICAVGVALSPVIWNITHR